MVLSEVRHQLRKFFTQNPKKKKQNIFSDCTAYCGIIIKSKKNLSSADALK